MKLTPPLLISLVVVASLLAVAICCHSRPALLPSPPPSPSTAPPTNPATTLAAQAQTDLNHQDIPAALQNAQAAQAAQDTPAHRILLSDALTAQALTLLHPRNPPDPMSIPYNVAPDASLIPALQLADQALTLRMVSQSNTLRQFVFSRAENNFLQLLRLREVPSLSIDAQAALTHFRHHYRTYACTSLDLWLSTLDDPTDLQSLSTYSALSNAPIEALNLSEDSADDYLNDLLPTLDSIFHQTDAFTDLDSNAGIFFGQNLVHWSGTSDQLYWNFLGNFSKIPFSPTQLQRVDAFLSKLQHSRHIAYALPAIQARLRLAVDPAFTPAHAIDRYQDALVLTQTALALPEDSVGQFHQDLYRNITEMAQITPFQKAQRIQSRVTLLNLFLQHHEIEVDSFKELLNDLAQQSPDQALDLGQRIAALASQPDTNFPGTSAAAVTLAFQELRQKLQPAPADHLTTTALFQTDYQHNLDQIAAVAVGADQAYAVLYGHLTPEKGLQILTVPFDGSPPTLLAWAKIPQPQNHYHFIRDFCATPDTLYLATNAGVAIIPTNHSPPSTLTTHDGLPLDSVRSLAFLDQKLYLGYGEFSGMGQGGYFAIFDPADKSVSLLASSRRKTKASPFDNLPAPFNIFFTLADPAHHRLLFYTESHSTPLMNDPLTGLWSFDPATHTFKLLLRCDTRLNPYWHSALQPDGTFLFGSAASLAAFDTTTDHATALYNVFGKGPITYGLKSDALIQGNLNLSPAFLFLRHVLWTANPLTRIPLHGPPQRYPDPGEGQKHSFTFLQSLPNHHLLYASDRSLYLLTP